MCIRDRFYDALDHEQLLWVHACLQISSIYFYEKTVRKLTNEEKNQYHEENTLAAEMVLVDRSQMPKTHNELKDWVFLCGKCHSKVKSQYVNTYQYGGTWKSKKN